MRVFAMSACTHLAGMVHPHQRRRMRALGRIELGYGQGLIGPRPAAAGHAGNGAQRVVEFGDQATRVAVRSCRLASRAHHACDCDPADLIATLYVLALMRER